MFEKLKFLYLFFIAIAGFFGFIYYVGLQMTRGQILGGNWGIMSMIAEALNGLSSMLGGFEAGYIVMALAVFGGVFSTIWVWRSY
ncbi:MAG: hypothetical protein EBT13_12205 [Rhodobacteraceae bacterium]|nr:hypothetical protein [Paracoccaceae bacterium]